MPIKIKQKTEQPSGKDAPNIEEYDLFATYSTLKQSIAHYIQGLRTRDSYLTNKSFSGTDSLDDRRVIINLYDSILRDAHLRSTLLTLRSKTLGRYYLGWDDLNDESDKVAKDFRATKIFSGKVADKIVNEVLDANFFGYSLLELGGKDEVTGKLKSVESIDRRNIYPDNGKNGMVAEYAGGAPTFDLDNEVFKENYVFINKEGLGLFEAVVPPVLSKKVSSSSFVSFIQNFGSPILHASTDSSDYIAKQNLANELASAVQNKVVVTDELDDLKIVATNNAASERIFLSMVETSNDEISNLIVGSIEQGGSSVAYKGSTAMSADTFADRVKMLQGALTNDINDEVIPRLQAKDILPKNPEGKKLVMYFGDNLELSSESKIKLYHELLQSKQYYIPVEEIEKDFSVVVEKIETEPTQQKSQTEVEAFLTGL